MQKNAIIFGGLCAAIAGLTYVIWPEPSAPDPSVQTAEERAEFMATKDFSRLDRDAKVAYMTAARELRAEEGGSRGEMFGQMDDGQRRQLRENMRSVGREMMQQRLTEYFELPEEERVEYLDRMIDEQMAEGGRRGPGGPGGMGGPPPGVRQGGGQGRDREGGRDRRGSFGPERMNQMLQNVSPEDRARMTEFRQAMRKRREERGLN